ncbi:MAG: hypothetical protein CVV44_03990 [Spirochaetae bacterium HGW-Spirochaetae-1]|jgi:hypothetical protein|nr:MAG: hypothetical protein CVV44_03990 [Spirochaetae bacterium HGW-Spirochaetae-1]
MKQIVRKRPWRLGEGDELFDRKTGQWYPVKGSSISSRHTGATQSIDWIYIDGAAYGYKALCIRFDRDHRGLVVRVDAKE